MNSNPLDTMPPAEIARYVGQHFLVAGGSATGVKLALAEVTAPRRHGARGEYEAFSLLFEGTADQPLLQSTYELQHDALGNVLIFMVPVAREGARLRYEAVFNRRCLQG